MNILASTTRQWNCGDEFIFFGVRNLLEEFYKDSINWVIYDRNPDLHDKGRILSDSWRGRGLDYIDEIVIAGSPQWFGKSMRDLFEKVLSDKRSPIFLGIGLGSKNDSFAGNARDLAVLRQAALITTRDPRAKKAVEQQAGVSAISRVCPAFFASKSANIRRRSRVGFCLQTNAGRGGHGITKELMDGAIELYKDIGGTIICHYMDEFEYAARNFSDVVYSSDAVDYLDIYNQFDVVISTRLHGAILAHSLGIPSFVLTSGDGKHTQRCSGAANMFPHLVATAPNNVPALLKELDIEGVSKSIVLFKDRERVNYLELLQEKLN